MKRALSFFLTLITALSAFVFPAFAKTYDVDTKIYAKNYILVNLDNSSYPVVAEKNSNERVYPASLTKMVTAIVTFEKVSDLSQKVTMSKEAFEILLGTEAQVANIEIGDEVTVEELLNLTLVHSACDACEMLAEFVSGSREVFVNEMNAWVQKIGCTDTHFTNPDGLHDENHYSTAADLAKISIECMKNEKFMEMASKQNYKFGSLTLPNTNFMIQPGYTSYYYEYAKGIKTGSTTEAGYCLASTASKDGYNYLCIVLGCPVVDYNNDGYVEKMSFIDSKSLYEWAFNGLKFQTVLKQNQVVSEAKVKNGRQADTVQLVVDKDLSTLVPANLDNSAIIVRASDDTPEEVSAPVKKGQKLGKAEIVYGNEVIAGADIVAAQDIEVSRMLAVINAIKKFFTSTFVKVVIIIILLCALFYAYIVFSSNRKKKKRKRARARQREERLSSSPQRRNMPPDDLEPPKRYR